MSVLENPFFTREVRAYARRAWSPLFWFILGAALLPLFPLWLGQNLDPANGKLEVASLRGLLLATVVVGHALLCAGTGWQLGLRVFGTEHRRHTLEGLRLVSTSPWVWVLQKLVFPLYVLWLVWLAVVPGCFTLVIQRLFLPTAVLPGLTLAACAGLLTFANALILPPERIGLPRNSERLLPLAERLELSALRLVPTWISWLMLKLGVLSIVEGAQGRPLLLIARSLFGVWWLREDHALAVLLGTYVASALCAAWAWANPSSPTASRLRVVTQRFAIGLGYLLLIGLTWEGGHWIWRAVLVGVPLFQGLQLWREQRKIRKAEQAARRRAGREDERSPREIETIQNWWDNPVLVRDLRVALRGHALFWIFVRQWLVIGMLAVVFGGLVFAGPWASRAWVDSLRMFSAMMAMTLAWVSFVSLMRIGTRASTQWAAERRMNTIPQLLLSPLSGRDIVRGRWVATLLEGVTASAPWVAAFLFFMLLTDPGDAVGMFLGLSLWLVSLALLLSVAQTAAVQPLRRWRDCFTAHGIALGLFLSQPFIVVWGLEAFDGSEQADVVALLLGLSFTNVVAISLLLWGAAANLETYRNRSLE